MGDCNYCSWIVVEMFFKPCHCFRVKMVCWFVKEKNVRFLEKKSAKSHTAAFSSRKCVDCLITRRTAQGIHCKFKIVVKIPCVKRIQFFLNFSLSCAQFVYVGIRIAKRFVYLFKFCK